MFTEINLKKKVQSRTLNPFFGLVVKTKYFLDQLRIPPFNEAKNLKLPKEHFEEHPEECLSMEVAWWNVAAMLSFVESLYDVKNPLDQQRTCLTFKPFLNGS